jgi:hypothetical protein
MGINLTHMNIQIHQSNENTNLENIQINPFIENLENVDNIENIKKNIINKLPTEIVIKIYKEYLEPELIYIRYKEIVLHHTAMLLNGEQLIKIIPIILAKPIVCKHISTKCNYFKETYTKHKINNIKTFRLMRKGQSFAATILFSMYH